MVAIHKKGHNQVVSNILPTPCQIKSCLWVLELTGAIIGRWRSGLEQNDCTDIEKAALPPGTIGFTLQPIPRGKSDHRCFFQEADAGVQLPCTRRGIRGGSEGELFCRPCQARGTLAEDRMLGEGPWGAIPALQPHRQLPWTLRSRFFLKVKSMGS